MTEQKSKYSEKLKDPRWQKKRLAILERDGWGCRFCNDDKSTLVVHHRDYLPGKEPWEYPDELLITLCEDCHFRQLDRSEIEQDMLHAMRAKTYTTEEPRIIQDAFEKLPNLDIQQAWMAANIIRWIFANPEVFKEMDERCWRDMNGD